MVSTCFGRVSFTNIHQILEMSHLDPAMAPSASGSARGEPQGARQSIGFQFDVKDSMLGAVLKYKDLQVPWRMGDIPSGYLT